MQWLCSSLAKDPLLGSLGKQRNKRHQFIGLKHMKVCCLDGELRVCESRLSPRNHCSHSCLPPFLLPCILGSNANSGHFQELTAQFCPKCFLCIIVFNPVDAIASFLQMRKLRHRQGSHLLKALQ